MAAVAFLKFGPLFLVLFPTLVQLAIIKRSAVPGTQSGVSTAVMNNNPALPLDNLPSEPTTLCSEQIKPAKRIDWDKMLGTWYIEAGTVPDTSGNRCVAQTFDEVDKDHGIVEKTMFVMPSASEDVATNLPTAERLNNVQKTQATQLKTIGIFDPLEPNTVISVFHSESGGSIPVETIILDTDYSTYALGYECSGQSTDGMAFEHMAILTRSAMPISAHNRTRLLRRALSQVPLTLRDQHKFYRSSKDGCGELQHHLIASSNTKKAEVITNESANDDFAIVLNPLDMYISPSVFNRDGRAKY